MSLTISLHRGANGSGEFWESNHRMGDSHHVLIQTSTIDGAYYLIEPWVDGAVQGYRGALPDCVIEAARRTQHGVALDLDYEWTETKARGRMTLKAKAANARPQ